MPRVKLSDIENVNPSDLSNKRLDTLLNGHSSFDEVLANASDTIALNGKAPPYQIIDGRHHIHLARKKGYREVNARFV
jgi:hypothetical protein